MNLTIVVATPDRQLATHFSLRKSGTLPIDIVKRGFYAEKKTTFSVFSYWSKADDAPKLDDFLFRLMQGTDGIILFCDDVLAEQCTLLSDALFVIRYPGTLMGRTIQNYFGYLFAKALKNFSAYAKRFNEGHLQKILLLPLRNFSAPELARLKEIFANNGAADNFQESLSQLLAQLNRRRTPKSASSYKDVYLKDDKDHFYIYGLERHSQLETGIPPHSMICKLNGAFRFGLKYDARRHFNVSARRDREYLAGKFVDCHNSQVTVQKTTHLNMFPNDFF